MDPQLSWAITSMYRGAEQFPPRQLWVGEGLCSDDDTVMLALYGEAALSVVRTRSPATALGLTVSLTRCR